jgi:ABC-type bacteriocin/lantibiotic exporter with double-glycine peptidase domain
MSSLAELRAAARELGLKAEGVQMQTTELRRSRPLGVLHTDAGHFVAVIGYADAGPRVADPVAPGKVMVSVWPYDRLSARWDGRILVVSP